MASSALPKQAKLKELKRITTKNGCSIVVCEGSVLDFVGDAMVNAANEGCVTGFGIDEFVNKSGGFELKEARKELGGCPTGQCRLTPSFNHRNTSFILHAVGPVYRKNGLKNLKQAFQNSSPLKTTDEKEDGSKMANLLSELKSNENLSYVSGSADAESERNDSITNTNSRDNSLTKTWAKEDLLLASAYKSCLLIGKERQFRSIGFCLLSAGVFRGERSLSEVLYIALETLYDNAYEGLKEVWVVGYTSEEQETLKTVANMLLSKLSQERIVEDIFVGPSKIWKVWGDSREKEESWLSAAEGNFREWQLCASDVAQKDNLKLIPKIIHHIWLGSELPPRCEQFRSSWSEHHAVIKGWTHLLWTDRHVAYAIQALQRKKKKVDLKEEQQNQLADEFDTSGFSEEQLKFKFKNVAAYQSATNYGEKSDILRYELLCQFGGIYVDCDVECLKPLDDLLVCRFFTGFSNTPAAVELNNGLIGSVPQHQIMKTAIRRISSEHSRRTVMSSNSTSALIGAFLEQAVVSNTQSAEDDTRVKAAAAAAAADTRVTDGRIEGETEDTVGLVTAGSVNAREVEAARTISRTGPGMFTKLVLEALLLACNSKRDKLEKVSQPVPLIQPKELPFDCVVFPKDWFYAIPNSASISLNGGGSCDANRGVSDKDREEELKLRWVSDNSRCVHYWDRSWT